MAANLSWYTTDPLAGGQQLIDQVISVTTAPETPAPFHALGTRLKGNNGSEWIMVKASTTVTAGNVVVIDQNYNANNATTTLGTSLRFRMGIAQFNQPGTSQSIQSTLLQATAQPGDFFWAATQGEGLVVNVSATAAAASQLFLSSVVPGSVTTTATSPVVRGLFVNASAGFAGTGSNSTIDVEAIIPIFTST